MFKQKDIVLIPFPYTDLTGSKLRPALIISNAQLNKTEDRICCLITSKPAPEGLSVKKDHFEQGSLPLKSWVKPHRVFTINERIIKKKLCTVNKTFHEDVLAELNRYIQHR